jgi:hypothetical protein
MSGRQLLCAGGRPPRIPSPCLSPRRRNRGVAPRASPPRITADVAHSQRGQVVAAGGCCHGLHGADHSHTPSQRSTRGSAPQPTSAVHGAAGIPFPRGPSACLRRAPTSRAGRRGTRPQTGAPVPCAPIAPPIPRPWPPPGHTGGPGLLDCHARPVPLRVRERAAVRLREVPGPWYTSPKARRRVEGPVAPSALAAGLSPWPGSVPVALLRYPLAGLRDPVAGSAPPRPDPECLLERRGSLAVPACVKVGDAEAVPRQRRPRPDHDHESPHNHRPSAPGHCPVSSGALRPAPCRPTGHALLPCRTAAFCHQMARQAWLHRKLTKWPPRTLEQGAYLRPRSDAGARCLGAAELPPRWPSSFPRSRPAAFAPTLSLALPGASPERTQQPLAHLRPRSLLWRVTEVLAEVRWQADERDGFRVLSGHECHPVASPELPHFAHGEVSA